MRLRGYKSVNIYRPILFASLFKNIHLFKFSLNRRQHTTQLTYMVANEKNLEIIIYL